jgi:hypothetical protein
METQILELIENEVKRRTQLHLNNNLAVISRLYEIPIERLVKDTAGTECSFCKGINKVKERCLKKPRENGYCGFHQSQAPQQLKEARPPPAQPPWET